MPLRGKDRAIANLRARSDQFLRAVALETHGRLVRRTPVDKGRARANWNVAKGAPDRSTAEERTSKDVGAQQAAGQRVIADFGPGEKLFVTNSLDYIPALEDGHSQQAPDGMVKTTVAEMRQLVSKAAASVAAGGE